MFLDINQSAYIFKQGIVIGIILIAIAIGLSIYLILRLVKNLKTSNSKQQEIGKTIFALLLIFCGYFFFLYPSLVKIIILKNRGSETKGITIRWVNTNDSKEVQYSFVENGETYTKQGEIVYGGKEIEGIVCPNGEYIVIYDKKEPENSVMDFKRPIK
jgi:ABC-type multidrug transport system fused ATPase/permease subunit